MVYFSPFHLKFDLLSPLMLLATKSLQCDLAHLLMEGLCLLSSFHISSVSCLIPTHYLSGRLFPSLYDYGCGTFHWPYLQSTILVKTVPMVSTPLFREVVIVAGKFLPCSMKNKVTSVRRPRCQQCVEEGECFPPGSDPWCEYGPTPWMFPTFR